MSCEERRNGRDGEERDGGHGMKKSRLGAEVGTGEIARKDEEGRDKIGSRDCEMRRSELYLKGDFDRSKITGIGERTTLADGNTWNHEHIATIGEGWT
eukprot:763997-Hanusia_phi.AAC.7